MSNRHPLLAQVRERVEPGPGTDTVPPLWKAPPWVEHKPSMTAQLWKGNSNERDDNS